MLIASKDADNMCWYVQKFDDRIDQLDDSWMHYLIVSSKTRVLFLPCSVQTAGLYLIDLLQDQTTALKKIANMFIKPDSSVKTEYVTLIHG